MFSLRFGTFVPWTIGQKSDVVVFDFYLDSRIMRLTMLEIGKNHQSWKLLLS